MPNKLQFTFAIVIMILSVIATILLSINNSPISAMLCWSDLIAGFFIFLHWNATSYIWKCSKCKNTLELSMMETFKGVNIGINKKSLFCETCGKKVPYDGVTKLESE